jgi:hypothetical protein
VTGIPRGVDTSKAALKAAAKGALSQHGRPGAHAAGAFPFSFGFNWGGAVLSVDRDLACSSVYGYQDLATLLVVSVFIPVPWNFVAMNAVSAYKGWMASQMGSQGVDISFNWWGSVTRIDPRGPHQPC